MLRDHILGNLAIASDSELPTRIQGGIDHCRRCAALPASLIGRVASVLGHLEDYRKYSRPYRSICKDMLAATAKKQDNLAGGL
jgi:hypothetical protein